MTVTGKNWYNTLEKFGELNRKGSGGDLFRVSAGNGCIEEIIDVYG